MHKTELTQNHAVYTISQLNNEVRYILEENYPAIWVEGEISNFAAPHSGHWYFSLKDAQAQVRCAMFRGNQRNLGFLPKDGAHILARARVSLYPNRGEYQLIVEHMEERGEGKLRRAYELLKKKLEEGGLFDTAHKKPLPVFPRQIGVITSATGAAVRDILTVLKRRFPCLPVIIYPTMVQGEAAAPGIVKAIQTANRRKECDVLILARGGGTLEDLWPFNEEIVAQAIYQSQLPIVSGVGHEVDFTIADYVADKRAPTPSAAAEMAAPDQAELRALLGRLQKQLVRQMQQRLTTSKQHLHWVQKHLSQQHPKRRLAEKIQRLDFLELSFVQLQTRFLNHLQYRLKEANAGLLRLVPSHKIDRFEAQIEFAQRHLMAGMLSGLAAKQTALAAAAGKLDALSPLATLGRGYAIVTTEDHAVVLSAATLSPGDTIKVRLFHGSLTCRVEKQA